MKLISLKRIVLSANLFLLLCTTGCSQQPSQKVYYSKEKDGFPRKLENYTQLEELTCPNCQVQKLPEDISKLKNLKKLTLSSNNLYSVCPQINQLTSLREVTIAINKLSALPEEFFELDLTSLMLSDNKFQEIPAGIEKFKNLKTLYFSSNLLTGQNLHYERLKAVENLDLSDSQDIRALSPALGNLQNLKTLDIRSIRISELPAELSKLKTLRKILLAGNDFTFFPRELTNCSSLEYLDISENYYLREIPPEIGKLTNLRYLNLYGVYAPSIPKEISKLVKLDTLLLSTDSLTNTDVLMTSLSSLHLSYLKLTQLPGNKVPSQIGKLTTLKELDIHGMTINNLPPELVNLRQLKRLDMSQISIGYVPSVVFDLHELEWLSLWACNISELPADIEKLTKLKILELGDNQLKNLPVESLVKLKNLKELNTYGNYALSESQKATLIKRMPWCTIN